MLGLDDDEGNEGVTLGVIDSGSTGITVHHGRAAYFLGVAPPGTLDESIKQPVDGLLLREGAAERRITATGAQ